MERVNQTVERKLGYWMKSNNSNKWSLGCKFVAWFYNTSYHNAVKNLPYVLVFGQEPKVGISNLPIDANLLNSLATEAELNDIIQIENEPDDVASDVNSSAGDAQVGGLVDDDDDAAAAAAAAAAAGDDDDDDDDAVAAAAAAAVAAAAHDDDHDDDASPNGGVISLPSQGGRRR